MTNTTKTSFKGGVASTLLRKPKFFGFSKAYNSILFFIFGGAMFGFGLARFMYIDIPGILSGPLPGWPLTDQNCQGLVRSVAKP